jgi:hypothetical protein
MTAPRPVTLLLSAAALLALTGLAGCRADYAADIRNQTPQPLFAQLVERRNDGTVLRARDRIGPGDRGVVGPIRAEKGRVGLVVDTLPNPEGALVRDLRPGTNYLNVRQLGESTGGELQVEQVTNPR